MARITYETNTGQKMHIKFDEQLILDLQEKNVDIVKELCQALSAEVRAELQSRNKGKT